jgi:hypothetical protein
VLPDILLLAGTQFSLAPKFVLSSLPLLMTLLLSTAIYDAGVAYGVLNVDCVDDADSYLAVALTNFFLFISQQFCRNTSAEYQIALRDLFKLNKKKAVPTFQ